MRWLLIVILICIFSHVFALFKNFFIFYHFSSLISELQSHLLIGPFNFTSNSWGGLCHAVAKVIFLKECSTKHITHLLGGGNCLLFPNSTQFLKVKGSLHLVLCNIISTRNNVCHIEDPPCIQIVSLTDTSNLQNILLDFLVEDEILLCWPLCVQTQLYPMNNFIIYILVCILFWIKSIEIVHISFLLLHSLKITDSFHVERPYINYTALYPVSKMFHVPFKSVSRNLNNAIVLEEHIIINVEKC